jgi:DNA-binding response OmpR family regulator
MPKRILLVDDEHDVLRLLRASLEQVGYEVMTAENGQEALERANVGKPDLILLDQEMPLMDGFEALRTLKGNPDTSKIPVVMLTGNSSDAGMSEGWNSGTDLYLVKPVLPGELIEFIQCIFE